MRDDELLIEKESQMNPYLVCPECECICVHPVYMKKIDGKDGYGAGWKGRGDLYVIGFWGECGHNFEVCFGFHKGSTFVFSRELPFLEERDGDIEALGPMPVRQGSLQLQLFAGCGIHSDEQPFQVI